MKDKFDTLTILYILTILVGNLPHNIKVSTIWVSVGIMSSRHSSRSEVGIGSKAQEGSLEFFIIVCNCVIATG